jgi:hypothetical protein
MGKKSRRSNKKSSDKAQPYPATTAASTDAAVTHKQQQQQPALLQRLRHSDPRTRDAALAGILHGNILNTVAGDTNLLNAVREQLMNPDIECAVTAAGCLVNYLQRENNKNNDSMDHNALTAGWIVICIGRLLQLQMNHQLEFTERLLEIIGTLLEENALASQRLVNHEQLRRDFQTVVSSCLVLTTTTTAPTATKNDHQPQQQLARILSLAARCLHSSWDDNPGLVLPWLGEAPQILDVMLQIMTQNNNATNNPTAQLHVTGAWLSAWSMDTKSMNARIAQHATATCLLRLTKTLETWQSLTDVQANSLVQAYAMYQQQTHDDELEDSVVRSVRDKKEPARQIAKRMQQQQQTAKQQQQFKDTAMNNDDNDETNNNDTTSSKLDANRIDAEEIWFQLVHEWQDHVRPPQLALELVANALLMPQLPDPCVQQLALAAHQFLVVKLNMQHQTTTTLLPQEVTESVLDLQSKAGTCLAHALTRNWTSPPATLWKDLKAFAPSVSNSMVLALQLVLQQHALAQDDIDFLMDMAQSSTEMVARDAVCMLGMCLEKQHSVDMNRAVCSALIRLVTKNDAQSSTMVLSEVLSVLIDIYGTDCHLQIFQELHVLQFFQTYMPELKRRIHLERNMDLDELEQYKETALNASRFIQYKKGAL